MRSENGIQPPPLRRGFPASRGETEEREEATKVAAGVIWGSCGFGPCNCQPGPPRTVREEASSPLGQCFWGSGLKLPGKGDGGLDSEKEVPYRAEGQTVVKC